MYGGYGAATSDVERLKCVMPPNEEVSTPTPKGGFEGGTPAYHF